MKDEISPAGNSFSATQSSGQRESPSSFRLDPSSFVKWFVQISRFGLAALFLFTSIAKLTIVRAFAANVGELLSASRFNYARWMWPVTVAVIGIEVITAALLLIPRTVRVGACCAAALLIGFAGYALYYVYILHGDPLECGCFGEILGSQLGVKTALRNLALLIPALIVFFGYSREPRAVSTDSNTHPATA